MAVAARSWLIRALILAGVAGVGALGWWARTWVSPERVRGQVVAHLNEQFEGVDVHVGSAHLRILGGIAVSDLRLTRRGEDQPFLSVPSAVLYHDKEKLNSGRLVIRKVDLQYPELHLVRSAEGRWNVTELAKPGPADRPVPTFVAKGARVTVTDRTPNGLPPVTFADASFTLLNDPLPVLTLQAAATAEGLGPVSLRARMNRISNQMSLGVEVADFAVTNAAKFADRLAPSLAPHLLKLTATASIKADLIYTPETASAWRHDVRVEVKDGKYSHPDLPKPVTNLTAKVRSNDGRIKVEDATATVGAAQVKLSLETRSESPPGRDAKRGADAAPADVLAAVEDELQRLDLSVTAVALDDELFKAAGDMGPKLKRMFSPSGSVDVGYKFAREAAGWKREFEARPRGIELSYEKFRYRVTDVRGCAKRTTTHSGPPATQVDLVGSVEGQPVTLKGQLVGDGPDPAVNLRIAGNNIPLTDTLIAALPGKYPDVVRQFAPVGRGDIVAELVQQQGENLFQNEFRIDIRDGTAKYKVFPYPVEKVKGRLVVRTTSTDAARPIRPGEPLAPPPDRDELVFDGFTAVHAGAAVWLNGSRRPVPGARDSKLVLHVGGNGCPLDADAKAALDAVKLESLWATFAPRGSLTFSADLEILDRAAPPNRPADDPPFNPTTDLQLSFNFSGPTVTPKFFAYDITDLRGLLEYKSGVAQVAHFAGRHGETRMRLNAGELRFYPDGAIWANLGGLEMKPFVADAALLAAIPSKLRSGFEDAKLRGNAELTVKHLVVLTPPDAPQIPPPEPLGLPMTSRNAVRHVVARGQIPTPAVPTPDPVVYWDIDLKLAGASVDTGVPWEQLFGGVSLRGRYDSTHLGLVRGNVYLDRAVVLRQPVSDLKAHVSAAPQQPDPIRPGQFLPPEVKLTNVSGKLFHGTLGGEVWVALATPPRYDLWLNATDVQLDEVAKHYKLGSDADLKGVAFAQLRLFNRSDPRTGKPVVEGAGKIDVPTGRMYNLPVLLDLMKLFKGSAPDKTAFEEAHVLFRIQGDRVKVDQLDLVGKAVCLGGTGEVDTSGEFVKFEFYTMWSQLLKQMINTPIGDFSAFVSKSLFKIKLTREGGELKYKPEPIPAVTEPVKNVVERMKARTARWK